MMRKPENGERATVRLLRNGKPVGWIEYEWGNADSLTGRIVIARTQPERIGKWIKEQAQGNEFGFRIAGGTKPERIGVFWEGFLQVLGAAKRQFGGLDYQLPKNAETFARQYDANRVRN